VARSSDFFVDGLSRSPTNGDPYLSVHAVNVYVRDQDKSLQFCLDRLGFHFGVGRPNAIGPALGSGSAAGMGPWC
jgi:hypothetical protein